MPCVHIQPADLIENAKKHVAAENIPSAELNNLVFSQGQNLEDDMWKSVYLEAECRDGQWMATKIDRNDFTLDPDKESFRVQLKDAS